MLAIINKIKQLLKEKSLYLAEQSRAKVGVTLATSKVPMVKLRIFGYIFHLVSEKTDHGRHVSRLLTT